MILIRFSLIADTDDGEVKSPRRARSGTRTVPTEPVLRCRTRNQMPGTRDRLTRHRSAPRRSLRFSFVLPFVVPAVCLTGLWGYTAAGLVDEHIQLQADADHDTSVARPAQAALS